MTGQNQLNWQRTNLDNIEQAWEGDLWDRKRLGIQLTNYVDRLNCGAVLALDARWGEGKTWFVRHWKKHLEAENHNVIYLDAFANDYLEDPFLVISSEITSCLAKDDNVSSQINTFKEKAAAAYQALLPSLPKVLLTLGLNLISGGVLGTLAQQAYETGEKVIESASDEIGEKIKESIEAKIESHEADKNTLLAFKQELAQLADKLEKPLVFVIDELDRCRPDFAIRLIERIKHFFDIPKIVFVLVMDKTQFSKVVCHNYGYDEKLGEEYLDKFVDFWVSLPKILKPSIDASIEYLSKLKELLLTVGEDSVDICLILFFEQYDKDFSTRTLKKRINQYALLKTNSVKINIFLMLSIISGANNLPEKIENIAKTLYKIGNGQDLMNFQRLSNSEIKLIEKTISNFFAIEAYEYIAFLEQVKNIYSRHRNTVSPDPQPKIQSELTQLYCKYSIQPLATYSDISGQFELYLKANLWDENNIEESK